MPDGFKVRDGPKKGLGGQELPVLCTHVIVQLNVTDKKCQNIFFSVNFSFSS